MDSSEMRVPWIVIPSVLDKLLEFDEVSSEIRNADSNYGKHLPPLPSCLSKSAPKIELHLSAPTARHTKENDCVAPGHLANNVQLISTMDHQPSPLNDDCEPDVPHRPLLPEKLRKFDLDSKCLLEHLPAPGTQCTSSAIENIEISTPEKVKSAATEQFNNPAQIQLLDVLADDDELVPDEVTEITALVSAIAVDKSDGGELGPAMTTVKLTPVDAVQRPRQDRRRSSFGRRLLKVGRMLCCFCCCPK